MMITRLPFSAPLPGRLTPYPDEPPYALLIRTAEHNGVFQPYTTFFRAGLTGGQAASELALDRVAFLCQQTVADVSRAAPIATSGTHAKIGGETLYRDQVSVKHRRWCPACLEELPYHRVWWDVMAVSACPDHGLAIVETCGCKRPPLWRSTPLMGCARGHRFGAAHAGPRAGSGAQRLRQGPHLRRPPRAGAAPRRARPRRGHPRHLADR